LIAEGEVVEHEAGELYVKPVVAFEVGEHLGLGGRRVRVGAHAREGEGDHFDGSRPGDERGGDPGEAVDVSKGGDEVVDALSRLWRGGARRYGDDGRTGVAGVSGEASLERCGGLSGIGVGGRHGGHPVPTESL